MKKTLFKLVVTVFSLTTYCFSNAQTSASYDFNSTSQLSQYFFNNNNPATVTAASTGGLSNSGSIAVTATSTNAIFVTKQGYANGGDGAVYTLRSFVKSIYNGGYSGMGFTSNSGSTHSRYAAPATGIGISVHGGGYVFNNDSSTISGSWGSANVKPSSISDLLNSGSPTDSWYLVELKITDLSGNNFKLRVSVWSANADGTLIRSAEDAIDERTFSNATMAAAPIIHSYFAFGGQRVSNFDNYSINLTGSSIVEDGAPSISGTGTLDSSVTNQINVSGNVLTAGSTALTERGFVYGTASGPTVAGTKLVDPSATTGSFTGTISGLAGGTAYYLRPFASNSGGVSYGSEFSITTGVVPDSIAPTLSTAAVSASGTSLVITASEALDATSVPAASSFTVTSGGVTVPVTGVAVSGSQITLTLGQTVGTGQSVSVAYTAPGSNPLKDAAGNLLASFGASSATNSSTQVLQLPSPLTKTAVVEGVKAQEKITSRASNFAMASVSNRLDWIRVNPGVSQRSYQGIKLRLANPTLDAIINGNYNQNSLGMDDLFEVGKQVASGANETALLKNKVNAEILNQLAGIKSGLGLTNLNVNPTGDAIVGKWSGWTYGEIIVGDNAADPTAITKIKAKNLAFGADRPTDKEGLIGFAVTLGNDEETVASNGSALDANLFSLAGYRSDQMDEGLAFDSMLGYTRMKFDTTRLDGSQTLTGKRLGDQLFAEVALRPVQESEAALKLTPFGKTSIVYSRLRTYTEQGGSYALFYGKQEQSMATVALGVDASYETYYAGARLLPSLGLEYGSSKKFGKGGSVRYLSETTVYSLDPDQAKTESVQLRLGIDYQKRKGQSLNVTVRRTLRNDQTRLTALRVMYTVPLN